MDFDEFNSLFDDNEGKRNGDKNGHNHDDVIASPWPERGKKYPRRLLRPVRVSATAGDSIDKSVVSYSLYNSFNYSMFLPKEHESAKLSLGITSPNYGEGKTTAVCNLAAAMSMGSGKRTVIVDCNLTRPRINEVFGIPDGPGLSEALIGSDVCVAPTQLDNLFVLPVGNTRILMLNKLPAFREILVSLFNEFDFVIVDLPPAGARTFPTLIANQLNGILVVVRARVTKRQEISRVFRKLSEKSIIGFVMNGVEENDL